MLVISASVVGATFMGRTVLRNPSWMSTYVMLSTLTEAHPESFLAIRARARGLDEVGEVEEASRHYEVAVELVPGDYSLLVEAAKFYGSHERWSDAERLLRRAIDLEPSHPVPWQVLSEHKLLQGLGREGHRIALQGLAIVGAHRDLWTLVSESYVAKGDFDAAIRARWAAFGVGEPDATAWRRMAELQELAGHTEEAAAAEKEAAAAEETAEAARARGLGAGTADPRRGPSPSPSAPR
jgi:predicted Zn-dependent protease